MSKKFQKKDKKKGKKYLFEEVLNVLKENPSKPMNYKQVSAAMGIDDHSQKLLINAILTDLVAKELVTEPERGKYKIKQTNNYITGKVDMTTTGSAFIVSEEREEDVFVHQRKMRGAMNGDTVKVLLYPERRGKQEGEVIEIIERGRSEFVGTIQLSSRYAFLVPDNQKVGTDIYIPLENLNKAKDGHKAVVKIIQWPRDGGSPIGEVIDVLGYAGENQTEMHAILAEFGLPYSFPKDVEKVADLIPTNITQEEIKKRRDFRDITTFTIDPFDAKDFDDALSIQKLPNGNWEIGVHIADVSHYVKPDSIIDREAISRATSVYLVDRVVPMLPEILSNNVCSLRPNEEKLCFSAVFEMDENANVLKEWFGRTIINSNKRFTYEEAQEIIETKKGIYSHEILILDSLAKKLRAERFKKGSIAFEKLEVKFHLDEAGNPTGVFFKQMKDSNQLIEDFMLLANRKVAEFVGKPTIVNQKTGYRPFVYRIHDKPNEDKLAGFAEFVKKFGYSINVKTDKEVAESMNKLLKDVDGKPEGGAIELLAIRTMSKAIYTTKNIGHYGLGFDYYTHFTSPIRRYPDVMVHRLLDHYLNNVKEKINESALEDDCKHSSDMEKLAAEAERASIKYKQVQYLQDKIGNEYDGVISGVTEWGIFVEIEENHCEGMIRLRDMRDDMYYYDEDNYCIVGKRLKQKFTLGDKVRIQVKRADLVKKQLDFVLIERLEKKNTPGLPPTQKKQNIKKIQSGKPKSQKESGKGKFNEEYGFEI